MLQFAVPEPTNESPKYWAQSLISAASIFPSPSLSTLSKQLQPFSTAGAKLHPVGHTPPFVVLRGSHG